VLNSERGLTQVEVDTRRQRYGGNDILETPPSGWLPLLKDTARDPMLWFLLGTALLFSVLGDRVEAATLLVAMVPLIGMDLYLHRRTRASTEGLSSRLAARAVVKRNGAVIEIAAAELVPGDLVTLSAGQSVPADGLLVSCEGVQIDESALSGEAYPVRKQPLPVLDVSLPQVPVDSLHWASAGTRVLTGTAALRTVYTGGETLYGQIVHSAVHGSHGRTPLQSAISNLVGTLLIAATILCVVLAWVRLRQGFGVVDALLSAVTLAVAALPEEFPVVFTFFLGVGVYRLAQRRTLVRRAVVVENIGRVSCVCSDKTGTITEGQLQLTHLFPNNGISEDRLHRVAALASRRETADPLDLAILGTAALPAGDAVAVAIFPFTEDRKRETAVWRHPDGTFFAVTKGAPEIVFDMCAFGADARARWDAKVTELAESGHKVIACAARDISAPAWAGGEPDRGLDFCGLLAFEDPVREGVVNAIARCREGGIHVIMVTGDHPATAGAVAREIGLGGGHPAVIAADRLDALLYQGGDALKSVDVIARAVPSQKLDLVRGLQSAGEVVAVTGDGVNDVPALQAADIGFAMGERGTRSAREVSAIVLLDDNFSTLIRAIAEGRQLFRNLKLSFAYLLMIHIPLVVTAALIPLAGYPLLYLPIHIVWLELIIHPTALLVFQELPDSDRLRAVHKTRRLQFFTRREWLVITLVGALVTLMIIGGYERSLGIGSNVEHARAMTLVTLTFASAMFTVILSRLSSHMSRLMVVITLVVTLVLVQTPSLASLLHVTPLHADDLALGVAGALAVAALAMLGRFGRER
jgi:Ca2+-transporting ATPase